MRLKARKNLLLFVLTFLLFSCKKENNKNNISLDAEFIKVEAKSWFLNLGQSLPDSLKKKFETVIENINSEKDASFVKEESGAVLFFLKITDKDPLFSEYVAFSKKDNNYQTIGLVKTSKTNLKKEVKNIEAFLNKGRLDVDFRLSFYDLLSRHISTYFGIADDGLKKLEVKKHNQGAQLTTNSSSVSSGCIDWYIVTTFTFSNGTSYQTEDYVGTTCNGGSCQLSDPNGSNWECLEPGNFGNTSTLIPNVTLDTIKKVLQKPCFISMVNGITAANFNNQVVRLFDDTYIGTGHRANLKFMENSSLLNTDGSKRAAKSIVEGSTHTWVIQLNPTYGDSVSTEFWGSIIVHELVHSFLTIYSPQSPPMTQFEQHELVFEKWINQMSDFLTQSYGISSTDAKSLALGGLDDVLKEYVGNDPVFKAKYVTMAQNKYNINLANAEILRGEYKSGTKGTVCN